MGEMESAYKNLVGKPEGKRPLGSSRHRWEDNVRMNFGEMCWYGVEWMHLVQIRGQ
jgi:hypothetical protein